jgi:hypothetical protein
MSLSHRYGLAYFELRDAGCVLRHLVNQIDKRPQEQESSARRHGTRECLKFFCHPLKGFLLTLWLYADLCLAYSIYIGFDYASGRFLSPSNQVGLYFGCLIVVLSTYLIGCLIRITVFSERQPVPVLMKEAAIALSGLLKAIGLIFC